MRLYCNMCEKKQHEDSFSSKQQRTQGYRFCLIHTAGAQRDWIRTLEGRAARANARDGVLWQPERYTVHTGFGGNSGGSHVDLHRMERSNSRPTHDRERQIREEWDRENQLESEEYESEEPLSDFIADDDEDGDEDGDDSGSAGALSDGDDEQEGEWDDAAGAGMRRPSRRLRASEANRESRRKKFEELTPRASGRTPSIQRRLSSGSTSGTGEAAPATPSSRKRKRVTRAIDSSDDEEGGANGDGDGGSSSESDVDKFRRFKSKGSAQKRAPPPPQPAMASPAAAVRRRSFIQDSEDDDD
eukprot:gene13936-19255_t